MDEIIDRLKKSAAARCLLSKPRPAQGKSAVVKEILQRDPHIKFSVSVTTRKTPRRRS